MFKLNKKVSKVHPASSTTKTSTGCHDLVEILLKVALKK
jgi:hypothetical protein